MRKTFYTFVQIMTPTEVRRSGNHLFHEVSVTQLIEGATGGPEAWKEVFPIFFNLNIYKLVQSLIQILISVKIGYIPETCI